MISFKFMEEFSPHPTNDLFLFVSARRVVYIYIVFSLSLSYLFGILVPSPAPRWRIPITFTQIVQTFRKKITPDLCKIFLVSQSVYRKFQWWMHMKSTHYISSTHYCVEGNSNIMESSTRSKIKSHIHLQAVLYINCI